MQDLFIVKIGGNVIDNEETLNTFIRDFAEIKGHKILIHGGGKLATELSAALGIETKMIKGRRITDGQTIKVVTMVYAGWVNKLITAKLQANSCAAIGLSGVDGALLPVVKRPVTDIDYGLVGDLLPQDINTTWLQTLLNSGSTVVVAPISCNAQGELLNINADSVASAIAESMSVVFNTSLFYCFEKDGLLQDVNNAASVIRHINTGQIELLKLNGTITAGMLPKIDTAAKAISNGVSKVVIGNAAHIKQLVNEQPGYGTHITQ